jgi:hypothetical protein
MNRCRRSRRTRGRRACRWQPSVVGGDSSAWAALKMPAAALAMVVLAGCGGAQGTGAVLAVEHAGFRVPVPDGWYAETTNDPVGQLRVVAFLSNEPMAVDCTGSGAARHCSHPATVVEGGLLAWWFAGTCAGVDCTPPEGDAVLVGGRAASRISGSAICEDLDATSGETYVVAVSPQRLDAIMVCQRGAPASAREQLTDMLEHVDWRTP